VCPAANDEFYMVGPSCNLRGLGGYRMFVTNFHVVRIVGDFLDHVLEEAVAWDHWVVLRRCVFTLE
jgi:hypothetical protein